MSVGRLVTVFGDARLAEMLISERYGNIAAPPTPILPCPPVILPLRTRQRQFIGCVFGLVEIQLTVISNTSKYLTNFLQPLPHSP